MYQPRPQARFLPSHFLLFVPWQHHLSTPSTNHRPCPPSFPTPTGSVRPAACTHPNKGGRKTCVMCQTPRPKRHKVAAPTKPPPRAGAAPPSAIETVATSTDPLPDRIPGTPRAGAAPPPAIEKAATAIDQLPTAFPSTTSPVNNVPALLTAADVILRTMGSADSSLDINDVGGGI